MKQGREEADERRGKLPGYLEDLYVYGKYAATHFNNSPTTTCFILYRERLNSQSVVILFILFNLQKHICIHFTVC